MAKKKYTLETLPKYTTSVEVDKLSQNERKELYKQCKGGRSCYLQDLGCFFEVAYNSDGNWNGTDYEYFYNG